MTPTVCDYDVEMIPCARCREPVETRWAKDGGGLLSSPDYDLIADCIFHSACWEALIKEHPP